MSIRRLSILGMLLVIGLLIGSACASSSGAPSASAPSPSTSASAKPSEKAAPPSASSSAKPAASPASNAAWDALVAAAKKEGKVVIAGGRGGAYDKAVAPFRKSYPEIQVEFTGVQGGDFAPKLLAERTGQQFLWDVLMGGATSGYTTLRPAGALDSVRDALILPEVTVDANWLGGYEEGWADKDRKLIYGFEGRLNPSFWVNRDMAPESELSSLDQLLEPKWKGKIAIGDPRGSGTANGVAAYLYRMKSEDYLRKLLKQDVVLMKDERLLTESVVRGRYPIMMGVNAASIETFRAEGLAGNLKPLAPDSPGGSTLSGGFGHVMLINKAPHPNAAKLFANWVLSREGQQAYVDATNLKSRRADVTGGPTELIPLPGVKYANNNNEDFSESKAKAVEISKSVLD